VKRDLLGVAEPRLKETYEFIIRTRPDMLWKGTFPVHHLSDKALQGKVLVRARRFEGMGKFDVPTSALSGLGGCDREGECSIHFKEPKTGTKHCHPSSQEAQCGHLRVSWWMTNLQ